MEVVLLMKDEDGSAFLSYTTFSYISEGGGFLPISRGAHAGQLRLWTRGGGMFYNTDQSVL